MACDERLVERTRAALEGLPGTGERRMFGGVCFTLNGNMLCGIAGADLMVRVGPERYQDALQRPHAREMDFTGRPMKGYVFVAPQGLKSEPALRRWVELGVAYVEALPPKARRRR
jgi:hypothetical protein